MCKATNYTIFFIFASFLFCSCSGKASNVDSTIIANNEVNDIPQLKIQRFDSLLFISLNDSKLQDSLTVLYPDLLSALGSVSINQSDIANKNFYPKLSSYFKNEILLKIYSEALSTFKNVTHYEKELSQANEIVKSKFQGKSLPEFAMHVSGFKANTLVTSRQISISIDKYLGYNYPVYQNFFEPYQRIQMQPQFISRDLLKAWIMSEIPPSTTPAKTLLDEMVYEGKILYILSELLPDWTLENIIGYNSEQYQWCVENESLVWRSIIDKKHLYNNEYFLNQKYISDAPYTATISIKSPGKVGCWIGWQIISSYAKNTGKSASDILKINDSQLLLKDSRYNPIQ